MTHISALAPQLFPYLAQQLGVEATFVRETEIFAVSTETVDIFHALRTLGNRYTLDAINKFLPRLYDCEFHEQRGFSELHTPLTKPETKDIEATELLSQLAHLLGAHSCFVDAAFLKLSKINAVAPKEAREALQSQYEDRVLTEFMALIASGQLSYLPADIEKLLYTGVSPSPKP